MNVPRHEYESFLAAVDQAEHTVEHWLELEVDGELVDTSYGPAEWVEPDEEWGNGFWTLADLSAWPNIAAALDRHFKITWSAAHADRCTRRAESGYAQ